jgi:hypothetical protein
MAGSLRHMPRSLPSSWNLAKCPARTAVRDRPYDSCQSLRWSPSPARDSAILERPASQRRPRRGFGSKWPDITSGVPARRAFSVTPFRLRDHHFDTLKFVQRLKDEGFTEEQAVAMMKVLSDVIEERWDLLLRYFCESGA